MIRKMILVGLFICILAFITPNYGKIQGEYVGGYIKRPIRPKIFNSLEEIRSYLYKFGKFMELSSRLRYGRRRREVVERPISFVLSKPNLQQYIDQQRTFDNPEDKLQSKTALRNYRDLFEMLVSVSI